MKREDIEKAGVADLVRGIQEDGDAGMKAKNPEKTTGRKIKRARYKIAQQTRREDSMLTRGLVH